MNGHSEGDITVVASASRGSSEVAGQDDLRKKQSEYQTSESGSGRTTAPGSTATSVCGDEDDEGFDIVMADRMHVHPLSASGPFPRGGMTIIAIYRTRGTICD